jgi:hypothetical protein
LAVENAIIPSISPLQSVDVGDAHRWVQNEHQRVPLIVAATVELSVMETGATPASKRYCLEAQQNMQSEINFLRIWKMVEVLKKILVMMRNAVKIAKEAV